MPARVHLTRADLENMITNARVNGNTELENRLTEAIPKPSPPGPARSVFASRELPMQKQVAEVLVTDPGELERLRALACPHIRHSPYWEEFVARRILVCTTCKEHHPGEFGEHRQPLLF